VKALYENIEPANLSDNLTKIEKLHELNRFLNEFGAQTKNVEKMLKTYIQLGLLSAEDKTEMIESIKQINGKYLNDLTV
jgi:hypothetical protein